MTDTSYTLPQNDELETAQADSRPKTADELIEELGYNKPSTNGSSTGESVSADPASLPEKISYNDMLKNSNAISAMYYALQDMGETVSEDPKQILDTFLTRQRYINVNELSTGVALFKESKYNDDQKAMLRTALTYLDKMPSFGSSEGAPTLSAITDYALAGITSPSNFITAVASAYTMGGAAAANVTIRSSILAARLAALKNPAVIKTLAVEGGIAGTAEATQNLMLQKLEKDIGLTKEINPYYVVGAGLLGGVSAPAFGLTLDLIGSYASKGIGNALEYFKVKPILEKNLLPSGGLNENFSRVMERENAITYSLGEKGADLQKSILEKAEKVFNAPEAKWTPQQVRLMNDALENNPAAIQQVRQLSNDLANDIGVLRNELIPEASAYGLRSNLNQQGLNTFVNNNNYLRNVATRYIGKKRSVPFDEFVQQNPSIVSDMQAIILQDKNSYFSQLQRGVQNPNEDFKYIWENFTDAKGNISFPQQRVDEIVEKYVKDLYEPLTGSRRNENVFSSRGAFPPAYSKIIGLNERPTQRIFESITGMMDTTSKSRMANGFAKEAIKINEAFRSATKDDAVRALGTTDLVKLVDPGNDKAVFSAPYTKLFTDDLKNVWVKKDFADKIKNFYDPVGIFDKALYSEGLGGWTLRNIYKLQTGIKTGKTVYNPPGVVRNFGSSLFYTSSSGNMPGVLSGLSSFRSLDPLDQKVFEKQLKNTGVLGSNVDLGQLNKRIRDIQNIDSDSFASKLADLKVTKTAKNIYGYGDDFFKTGIYYNERQNLKKILNDYPDPNIKIQTLNNFERDFPELIADQQDMLVRNFNRAERNQLLRKFRNEYNNQALSFRDMAKEMAYLSEEATKNVNNLAPVYSRIATVLEKSSAIPVIGNFTGFVTERLRNTHNLFKTATNEMRMGFETGNKTLQRRGIERLMSWYATRMGIYGGAVAFNEAMGMTEAIEKLKQSNIISPYERNDTLIGVGLNKYGLPDYINLSYMDPDHYIFGAFMPILSKAAMGQDVSKDIDESIKYAAKKLYEPYLDPTFIVQIGDNIANAITNPRVAAGDAALNTYKLVEPGIVKSFRNAITSTGITDNTAFSALDRALNPRSFGGMPKRTDNPIDWISTNAMDNLGLSVKSIDPRKFTGFALKEISEPSRISWNNFKQKLTSTLSDPTSSYTFQDMGKEYDAALKAQFEYQKNLRKLDDTLYYFMSRNEIDRIYKLKDLSGVAPSQNVINGIVRRSFTPQRLSSEGNYWTDIRKSMENKVGGFNADELQKLRGLFNEIENYYRGADLYGEPPDIKIGG